MSKKKITKFIKEVELLKKLKNLERGKLAMLFAVILLAGAGVVLGLNGYFGGGAILEDTATRGLVGYWNMDEGGGQTAKDLSNNGNNGTLGSSTSSDQADPKWTKGQSSVGGLSFDGVDDYVSIGDVYDGVKSVSFWLKAGNTTQNILDLNGTDYIQVSAGVIAATGAGWISPTIYVDGKEATTIDTAWRYITITTATGVNASAVNLGKFSANYFNGILDDVRIYNRALSFEEINYLYNEKKPVIQWDMDEGAGATVHDAKGNLDIAFPAASDERPTWTKP